MNEMRAALELSFRDQLEQTHQKLMDTASLWENWKPDDPSETDNLLAMLAADLNTISKLLERANLRQPATFCQDELSERTVTRPPPPETEIKQRTLLLSACL